MIEHDGYLVDPNRQTIRGRRARGESAKAVAAEFGVTHQSIYNACNRRTWAEVA